MLDHVAHRKRGPRERRGAVADSILAAARERFASDGYAGTTLRAIAADVAVDTKAVRYYYDTKDNLLAACLETPTEFLAGALRAGNAPLAQRGAAFVRQVLDAWRNPTMAAILRSTLLIAAHEQIAMDKLRQVFVQNLLPSVSDSLPDPDRDTRAGLVATQLIGLATARFVYRIDQVAAIPDDTIIGLVGATIQNYLTAPITTQS